MGVESFRSFSVSVGRPNDPIQRNLLEPQTTVESLRRRRGNFKSGREEDISEFGVKGKERGQKHGNFGKSNFKLITSSYNRIVFIEGPYTRNGRKVGLRLREILAIP